MYKKGYIDRKRPLTYEINGEKIIVLKPQKYINLSGEVIRKYIDFYKIPIENILVINDDMDLEVGAFKLRLSGGSAGHNGLKNIESHLNTKEYKRIKVGISKNNMFDKKDYVLGKISKDEEEKLKEIEKIVMNLVIYVSILFHAFLSRPAF